MTERCAAWKRGALAGLTLFLVCGAAADDTLRERIHREHKHHSYMLIEDAGGARLFLFDDGVSTVQVDADSTLIDAALAKTRSIDPRVRVVGLVELAGAADAVALEVALTLLTDPDPAVCAEARQLILDHPDGQATADALGLVDDEFAD